MLVWLDLMKIVYSIELPWEDRVEEANELKKAKYAEMAGEAAQRGWSTRLRPIEIGMWGFVGWLVTCPWQQNESEWLWVRRKLPGVQAKESQLTNVLMLVWSGLGVGLGVGLGLGIRCSKESIWMH